MGFLNRHWAVIIATIVHGGIIGGMLTAFDKPLPPPPPTLLEMVPPEPTSERLATAPEQPVLLADVQPQPPPEPPPPPELQPPPPPDMVRPVQPETVTEVEPVTTVATEIIAEAVEAVEPEVVVSRVQPPPPPRPVAVRQPLPPPPRPPAPPPSQVVPPTPVIEPPRVAALPPAVVAPRQSVAAPAGPPPDYLSMLRTTLERNKVYPRSAQARRQQGTALLRFVIARNGQVLRWSIERSSGFSVLDSEVEAMIQRASPLPPMPEEMRQAELEILVPIAFSLR